MTSDEVRVLVVDDNPDARTALSELLTLYRYKVFTAADGEEALRVAEASRPHCVLLDIAMPGMNGLDLTRRLRELYGDDIVLVAVTGTMPDDLVAARTFSLVDHYLLKPIALPKLQRVLPPL